MSNLPTKKMKRRLKAYCAILMCIGFTWVTLNVGYNSLVRGEELKSLAVEQQLDDMTVKPKRGIIYDRNMTILAQSATVYTVYIAPNEMKGNMDDAQKELIASMLSEKLEVDKEQITAKIQKSDSKYQEIKRKVEKPVKDEIQAFMLENELVGVHYGEDSKRYYPYGNFASSVIGFTGTDNNGLYGIEAKYDKYLAGTPGRTVRATNAKGLDMPFKYEKYYDAQEGNGVILTIDETIQHFLESALEDVLVQHKVREGVAGIVMDVNTGEILAMATKPDFDLNDPFTIASEEVSAYIETLSGDERTTALGEAREDQWRNKALTERYEPGSVFKVVTGSAALEEQVVGLGSTFSCPGYHVVAGRTIRCHKSGGHGTQNFTETMVNSCNPAFMKIGAALGEDKFFEYFKAYGLTEKTGIDLPGEVTSLYYTAEQYGPVELASSSFGQSNAVTPIEMMTAFCAVVNGGYLLEPYVVKEVVDQNNATVFANTRTVRRQVISEETSELMRGVLEQVVTANGGSNAYVKGFDIGGKSGTSEKLSAQDKSDRISSFIGFAPVDNPQIAVMVMADVPTNGAVYGSVVAAPAVASVMADTLPYLGINPQYSAEDLEKLDVTVPNILGLTIGEAKSKLLARGLDMETVGEGDKIVRVFPSNGSQVPRDGKVIAYTTEAENVTTTVPNIVGMNPQKAMQVLENAGLNIRYKTGRPDADGVNVSTQSSAEGATVPRGTIIEVDCVSILADGE